MMRSSPRFLSCGGTYQEALKNVQVVIREWIETASELLWRYVLSRVIYGTRISLRSDW